MFRMRHLANDEVQSSDNSTYSLRLPVTGFIHTLYVTASITNGATSGRGVNIFSAIDEIRVVGDGDERMFTLTPAELEKWYETQWGMGLSMVETQVADGVQSAVFPILFGRFFYDANFFLPLGRIKNPRLEIVYSPSIAADAGFATGTTTFDVVALWTPEQDRLNYAGTIVTRTVEAFTSVASGDNTTDIDILDPIRAVGVYAYEASVEDGTDVTRVRLEANSGEFDIWQGDWKNLIAYNKSLFWGRVVHNAHLLLTNNETWNCRLGNVKQFSIEVLETTDLADDSFQLFRVDAITGDLLTFDGADVDITADSEVITATSADSDLYVSVEGDSPSYFGLLPFYMNDEPGSYLNPREFDKLRLILTQGGAGATVRNSIQFVKTY